jgi:hypothetical protein
MNVNLSNRLFKVNSEIMATKQSRDLPSKILRQFSNKLKTEAPQAGQRKKALGKIIDWQSDFAIKLFFHFFSKK